MKAAAMRPSLNLMLCALLACGASLQAQAQNDAIEGVDKTIHPGDDFFAYANGQWLNTRDIPSGRTRWSVGNEIQALAQQQVSQLLNQLATQPPGASDGTARKVADFRAAFLDEATIEARGLAPIKSQLLDRIEAINNKRALARFLGSELRADVDPMGFGGAQSKHLFGLAVDKGIQGEQRNAAILVQGGLGLPDREHYLSPAAPMQALRVQYRDHLAQLWRLAGGSPAPQRIEAVMALETAIARSHATKEDSAREENANQRWTHHDFAQEAPGLDWAAFFAAAGLTRSGTWAPVIVWQPNAAKGAAALVAAQPLQVWKDYLRLRAVDRHAYVLPRAFAQAASALHDVAVAGASEAPSRAQQATAAVQQALGEGVSRLYVQRHFPAEYKARVQSIAAQVQLVLRERMAAVNWLADAGKAQALVKLETVYFGLGYPERWADDSTLVVRRDDAFGNRRRAEQWHTRLALARLGQPVDTRRWALPSHTIAAGLDFTKNAYNFPAALLQETKFDAVRSLQALKAGEPDAANYGAIGAIVGHELTHFFDELGADYDLQGAKRRSWTDADLARYRAATKPLVEQFSNYRPFEDVAVDGQAALVENLADLMGLSAAFEAYRRTLGARASDPEFVKRHDRLFFIGFARSWRAKNNDEALRKRARSDHPPEPYRIATVRNLDAWYEAFDVRPGHRLYLPPADRVRVW
jgi:putative endopeptidase